MLQAYLDAAKAVLLSSLESKREAYRAPATPTMPKLSSAELQLERQMENLGRCNRPAEAAALQDEVLQNRRAAAERLEQARLKAFERKVCDAGSRADACHRCARYNLGGPSFPFGCLLTVCRP